MHPRRAVHIGVGIGTSSDLAAVVDHAVRAEELGYDHVVTIDDVATGDEWTLLSWIAGRTQRVGLASTRLNATLVHPTVLARATAGLDLLTAGRVTVGLGSGPGHSTASLADTIAIARRMWGSAGATVHHQGHHSVTGAAAGPTPAHDIGIWLTGDDEGTIELAGHSADGWIGRLDATAPDRLAGQLALLQKAIARAERDPRELERVVVVTDHAGPSEQWVGDLARLVADHGVNALVLQVDQDSPPDLLERFIDEVAPELQHAAHGASSGTPIRAGRLRRSDVRAERRPGIDYDSLPDSLADSAIEPGDATYRSVRSTYLRGGAPGLVLRPGDPAGVAEAVAYARRHTHLPLGVRSGGHGLSGRSTNDGGLVIDVSALHRIEVLDPAQRLVRIQPGARWKQVATALQPHGWALTSGDYGGVGVGGLATAGGIGFLGRRQGLTIDRLRAVEVVLADGSLVRTDGTHDPELFWAMRGAGANFGIATAFEFVVDDLPDVGWAQLAFAINDPAQFLVDFSRVASAAPRDTTAFLIMGGTGMAQVLAMVASADPDVVIDQLQPFARIAPLVQQNVVIAPYAAVMNMFPDSPHMAQGEPVSRSGLVNGISPAMAAEINRLLGSGAVHWFQLRSMGGAIADVAPETTAFAHRTAAFQITAMGSNAQRVDRHWNALRPHLDGVYLSFETDTDPDRLIEAFGPDALVRLRRLKTELDPRNLFRDNFNIVPTPTTASGRPA